MSRPADPDVVALLRRRGAPEADLDPPELARLHLSAAREGLAVFVSGHSPWNPGATLAVTFTQKRR